MHPEYKQYINPGALRRMSNVIRMGLTASRISLENAGIEQPGAIVIGSGLGCVQDTAKFLNQVISQNEQLLNPTPFIQSTHNTVSGQIALMLGCREYNLTFSQKSFSFESALLDAIMLSGENARRSILLGGIDEIVPESYKLMVESGCAKGSFEEDMFNSNTPGAVAGEGAAFFVLSGEKDAGSMARIDDLEILNGYRGTGELHNQLNTFLDRNGITPDEIDLVVSGRNGDVRFRGVFDEIEGHFKNSILSGYKHLVGEYDTAISFGLFLASRIIQFNDIPHAVRFNHMDRKKISKVLVFNGSKGQDFSFILLSNVA
jgi:3-oxoacyl-(acyl-carrier-protein) synthase